MIMEAMKVQKRTALSAGEPIASRLREVLGEYVNGVFPDKARTDIKLPYIIYQVEGESETNDKSRSSFLDSCTVVLHCFATHYSEAVALAELCRSALCGYIISHTFDDGSSIKIDCSKVTGFGGDVDPDCYDRILNVSCRIC